MTKALIAGKPLPVVLDLAGRLRAKREVLFEALQPEELTATHRFVLSGLLDHIEYLEAQIQRFELELLANLAPWEQQMVLLQTIPGIDTVGAAMLLVEISEDVNSFGSAAWPWRQADGGPLDR